MSTYQEKTLENGLQIFSYPLNHLHSIEAALYFKAGPLYEQKNNYGISHLLQHMCLRDLNGILKQELVARLDAIGTSLEGSVYPEAVVFRMRFSPRFFDEAMTIFSHFFVPALWKDKEILEEKAVVLRQIENEDPDFWADAQEHYWRTDEEIHSIRGTLESVTQITCDMLNTYKKLVIRPANACLVLTGNFSSGMLHTAQEVLSQWKGEPASDTEEFFQQPLPFNFCYRDEKNDILIENTSHKAHVQLSFDINDDLLFPICVDILNTIVGEGPGSAMYVALRDQQALTDEVSSFIEEVGRFRRMIITFSLPNTSLEEGLRAAFTVIYKLTQHISTRKMNRTRAYFKDNIAFALDDVLEMNNRLGWGYLSDRVEECDTETLEYMYDDVTVEDVLEAAQIVFRPENLSCYICHHPATVSSHRLQTLLKNVRNQFL
ncbi:MAG: insulinase family protein [Clostridiales bacterium]|nr:insulinase family protein [Clostridiales bacterium]